MIRRDQPTIFGDAVTSGVSSVDDGPMNFRGNDFDDIKNNRAMFLSEVGIEPLQATLLQVSFDDDKDFSTYTVIEEEHLGEGMLEPISSTLADAMVATRPDQAIFLPLADCVGAILFDPINQLLMESHLGRHCIEVNGGQKSVEYLAREFDSVPGELLIWLSPAVGKASYPLHSFGGKSLHEVAVQQLLKAGALPNNIEISSVDTAESDDYFSHSDFLAGNRERDDRFAIVAMMAT